MRQTATVGAFGLGAAFLALGCGARTPLGGSFDTDTTTASGTTGDPPAPQRELDKLDILLSVDDSISMADKQRLLKAAVPDLIGRLANPLCVDVRRHEFPERTPPAGEPCPAGPNGEPLYREFLPVSDVHVGVVTSTLGNGGALGAPSNKAHLLGSFRAGVEGATAEGFLAWDPGKPQAQFDAEVQTMMEQVGEKGSGYEAPLEAWFRFLVEPEPYQTLAYVPCSQDDPSVECIEEQGLDTELLEQRRAFLRPDSVLVIIVLSDEDDCSARVEGTNWQFFTEGALLDRGTTACNTDPNDPCCAPCSAAPAPDCAVDPSCSPDPRSYEHSNLLCFEPKRRYGRDALMPIERYKRALTERELCPERADLASSESCSRVVDNPLFVDLESGEPAARTPGAVFLTSIVGVPWHDLATDPRPLLDPNVDGLVYKSSAEMDSDGTWELLLGSTLAPPRDPLMLQSVDERSGTHPITGETIAGSSAWPVVNSINGHDRSITYRDDLQYACTFPLPRVRNCEGKTPCDCSNPVRGISPDNPMCQDAVTGEYSAWQHSGKAYPGQRHAALARELGDNAVLSSICARNTDDPARADYAYRPTVAALVTRMAPILQQPE